jgi:hypothetical protein
MVIKIHIILKPGVYRDVYEEIIRQAVLRADERHDLLNST